MKLLGTFTICTLLCFIFAVPEESSTSPLGNDQTASQTKMLAETKAVERACLDYVEGIYEVKPEWIKRSVHPDLRKFGFARNKNKDGYREFRWISIAW